MVWGDKMARKKITRREVPRPEWCTEECSWFYIPVDGGNLEYPLCQGFCPKHQINIDAPVLVYSGGHWRHHFTYVQGALDLLEALKESQCDGDVYAGH